MDTIKVIRPSTIPSDFEVVLCCLACGEPMVFEKGFLERLVPDNLRFVDGTKPLPGSSIYVPCPKCGASNNIGGYGKWKLIGRTET